MFAYDQSNTCLILLGYTVKVGETKGKRLKGVKMLDFAVHVCLVGMHVPSTTRGFMLKLAHLRRYHY